MSARTVVLDTLETIIANVPELADVRLVRAPREVGELGSTPIIVVKTGEYARTPEAPLRNVTWSGTATLVSPHRDVDKAEDDLEARLEVITPRLTTAALKWLNAELVNYDDQHLALDIHLTAIFQKE